MKTELFLASRYLFRGKARHVSFIGIISCLGIALGVGTLIVVISVMNGFDRDLTERLTKFNYHLTVEAGNTSDGGNLAEISEELNNFEEINNCSQFLQTQVFAKLGKIVFPLTVKGVDLSNELEKREFYKYVLRENGDKGFFIGEGLSRRIFPVKNIDFYPLKKSFKLQTAEIRGVFKVGLYDVDSSYLISDLETAKSLSDNYLIFLGVRLKDPFSAPRVKQKILEKLKYRVFVSTWIESNQILFSALKLEKITMFIILSLIILVASFNIFATLTTGVVEKTKDIGILKALGFTRRRILTVFSLQGILLGGIGTIFGTILGLGLCIFLKQYPLIKLPEAIYYIEYLPVAINYRDILLIMFTGFLLSYICSLFPALRAAKMRPSEALRYG